MGNTIPRAEKIKEKRLQKLLLSLGVVLLDMLVNQLNWLLFLPKVLKLTKVLVIAKTQCLLTLIIYDFEEHLL
jgi:hypothetical protein